MAQGPYVFGQYPQTSMAELSSHADNFQQVTGPSTGSSHPPPPPPPPHEPHEELGAKPVRTVHEVAAASAGKEITVSSTKGKRKRNSRSTNSHDSCQPPPPPGAPPPPPRDPPPARQPPLPLGPPSSSAKRKNKDSGKGKKRASATLTASSPPQVPLDTGGKRQKKSNNKAIIRALFDDNEGFVATCPIQLDEKLGSVFQGYLNFHPHLKYPQDSYVFTYDGKKLHREDTIQDLRKYEHMNIQDGERILCRSFKDMQNKPTSDK